MNCTKKEIEVFKKQVIAFFKENGITNLHLRAQRNYDGNVKIYTGGEMEFTNCRSSFRRETPIVREDGSIAGWHGTRGKHTTVHRNATYAYRLQWTDEDKDLLLSDYRHEIGIRGGTK